MKVNLYVEGGGDGRVLRGRCKEGFSKLLKKCFPDHMPKIIAGGSRNRTFEMFETALSEGDPSTCPILLVDSEDPVIGTNFSPDTSLAWDHLIGRDRWIRPIGSSNKQAQLMTTCMETWIMADHEAIISFFGSKTRRNALLPLHNLEGRNRHEVQETLEHATEDCGRDKAYKKGKRSFQVLAELNPIILDQNLPSFHRFKETLSDILA
ncbi:MAG: DUF4276 family protein [Methanoregula sp.]|nr:DUF4276 family protein [Methanoregula sp.]